jgi:hypothetical protein
MSNGTTAPGESSNNRVIIGIVAVLLLAAVAVGFYFIGKAAADDKAAEDRGVDKGRAEFAQGTPGYRRIFAAGAAAGNQVGKRTGEEAGAERGKRVGFETGQKAGQLQGEREGQQSGANAALGGFTDWEPGSFYIVKFGTGTNGVPFVIDSRTQMSSDERYAICANNPGDICTEAITSG